MKTSRRNFLWTGLLWLPNAASAQSLLLKRQSLDSLQQVKPATAGGGPPGMWTSWLEVDSISQADNIDVTNWTAFAGPDATVSGGSTFKFRTNIQNGLSGMEAVVTGSGVSMSTAAFGPLNQPFVFFLGYKRTVQATNHFIVDTVHSTDKRFVYYVDNANQRRVFAGTGFDDVNGAETVVASYIISIDCNGASSKYRLNGGTETGFSLTGTNGIDSLYLGYTNPFRVPITGGSHSGEVWKYNYLGANPLLDVEAVFFSQYTGGPPLYPGHRAADNDTTDEMASAWKVQVTSGTVHAGQTWAYIPSATDWTFSQLTALTSVDGVSVTTSDRVLLVGQNNPAENGIYTIPSGGILTLSNRSSDADNAGEFAASFTVSVTSGTEHGGEQWAFLWSHPVTLNTTALNFVNRAAPTSGSFRVVPASAWFEADVADLYDAGTNPNGLTSEDTFDFSDPTAPVVRWTAHFVASGGSWTAITVFSTMYVPNTHFRFEFEATDPNRDLDGYTLNARKGGGDVIHLATEQFAEGTAIATRGVEFALADVGEYDFELSVRDRSGRLTLLPLSSIRIQAGSPTMVSNPVFVPTWNKKRDHADVTFTCATPSATIKWQKQSKGTAPNGGAWTTWTGNKVGVDVKQKVLYAYAVKSGLTDSAVVSLTG